MKNKLLMLLPVLCLCVALTACGGEPSPTDDPVTTTTRAADTSTTTTTTTAADTTTTTTTTTAADTTTTTLTNSTETPNDTVNPFDGVSAVEIALYDTHLFQMEEAVLVKQVSDDAQVASIIQKLTAATWVHYPDESNWVKYEPVFAQWALVLTDADEKQHILHLLDETVGWASLATFDGNLSYADVIAQAKAHDQEGIDDFVRYKMDADTLAYLLSLFK